ncbi:matrixin family metalloprotease [Nocardioides dilutus]
MRGMRTITALAVALGLSGVSLVPADGAPAPAPPQVSERAGGKSAPDVGTEDGAPRVLLDDVIRPARSSVAARVRKWPGRTIPYFEKIPAKWDWSLDRAIAHWNESGSKIKFVEVPRRKAKLLISYGDTGGADGVGTLGYQHRNYVYLSPAYKKADQFNPTTRVWVGRLFAHELGHVLGFDHTPGQCALMYPVYNFGVCDTLAPGKPGYYNCRWIDKKLLRRFTQMYGGKPKRPPKTCLIEELPGELKNVTFSGGNAEAKPVRITWASPATVRDGTKVYVTVWKGTSCSAAPDSWERRVSVDPKAGSWTDPAYGLGTWCYLVHIENRYGAARPATGRAISRYAPVPAAPTLGAPTWDPASFGFHLSWTPPDEHTSLNVMRDDDPATCPTVYDPSSADGLYSESPGSWFLSTYHATQCVSLFAVTDWGTVSAGTQVVLQVPPPPVTPTVSAVGTYTEDPSAASATASLPPGGSYNLGIEVLPGTCPAVVPGDLEWWDGYQDWNTPDLWYFYPEPWGSTEQHCALFAAIDDFGQHGPVVKRQFTLAAP